MVHHDVKEKKAIFIRRKREKEKFLLFLIQYNVKKRKREKEKKRKREKEKKRIDSLYFNNIKTFLLFTFLILQALS